MNSEKERIDALLKEATPEAATTLTELAEHTPSKEIRKAARRALYLLGERGIKPVPEVADAVLEADPVDPLRCYATNFDGAGNRVLFFELTPPEGGSITAVQMLVNDVNGLRDSDVSRITQRSLRERLLKLEELQSEGLAFVEIPADYGRWLLSEARELLRLRNRPSPAGVMELLPRIGAPKHDYLVSPIYDSVSAESVLADETVARDPAELIALKWFESWFFEVSEVARWMDAWRRLTADPSDEGDAETVREREEIVSEVTTTLFTPATRQRYVRRLEETADILWRVSREAEARMALYHAQMLAQDAPVATVPFARLLAERTLMAGLIVQEE